MNGRGLDCGTKGKGGDGAFWSYPHNRIPDAHRLGLALSKKTNCGILSSRRATIGARRHGGDRSKFFDQHRREQREGGQGEFGEDEKGRA